MLYLLSLFLFPAYLLILLLKGRLKERVKALGRDQLILAWACGLGPSLFWMNTHPYSTLRNRAEILDMEALCITLLFLIPITWQWMEAQKNEEKKMKEDGTSSDNERPMAETKQVPFDIPEGEDVRNFVLKQIRSTVESKTRKATDEALDQIIAQQDKGGYSWTKIGEDESAGVTVYVDFERISFNALDGYVYWWELADYVKRDEHGCMSIKMYKQADYDQFRYKYLNMKAYEEPMGKGDVIYNINESAKICDWDYPEPESSEGFKIKAVVAHVESNMDRMGTVRDQDGHAWTKIGEADQAAFGLMNPTHAAIKRGDTYYVDFERIEEQDGFVYFWILTDFPKPRSAGDMSAKTCYQSDLDLFNYEPVSFTYYSEPMGKGTPVVRNLEESEKGACVPGNSIEEIVLNAVCRYVTGKNSPYLSLMREREEMEKQEE